MASTQLLRTLFMPKAISDTVRPQVLICKPYYRNNAFTIRAASSSSKRPPIRKGSGQKINSTASDNKDYSASSISDRKDGKKNDEKAPDATAEKSCEAIEK
ncbi:hypothetical protein L484_024603 [Morus notabilis]|uniref:Uncharacterized protein n=1 Tax=Morus notabilis TaxID=981085 RepID=W9R204_9ROSA|nr:hypothetical protein L484_024603 [Morus notabilis]